MMSSSIEVGLTSMFQHLTSGRKKQIGVRVKNLYKLQVETDTTLSNKVGSSQKGKVIFEREQDRALKIESQPESQFESRLVGSWAEQQDDEGHSLGRVEATTQSMTPSMGRV